MYDQGTWSIICLGKYVIKNQPTVWAWISNEDKGWAGVFNKRSKWVLGYNGDHGNNRYDNGGEYHQNWHKILGNHKKHHPVYQHRVMQHITLNTTIINIV